MRPRYAGTIHSESNKRRIFLRAVEAIGMSNWNSVDTGDKPTPKQVGFLLAFGFRRARINKMSRETASRYIGALQETAAYRSFLRRNLQGKEGTPPSTSEQG